MSAARNRPQALAGPLEWPELRIPILPRGDECPVSGPGSVSYVPSNLRFTLNETETTADANLLLGTLRATFHTIPLTSPVWLTLNGGASMIRRGGEAYAEAEDKSDFGGVVGATVGFRLGSMLSFYVAPEDYIWATKSRRRKAASSGR